jgi:2Fe-2S iron-sulfur cluster binding domain
MLRLTIDGTTASCPPGASVLEAAASAGKDVPAMSYDPRRALPTPAECPLHQFRDWWLPTDSGCPVGCCSARSRREIAFGAVGEFWQPVIEWHDLPGFATFAEPGWERSPQTST